MESIKSMKGCIKDYFLAFVYSVLLASLLGASDVILEFSSQRNPAVEFELWMLWLNFFLVFVVAFGAYLISPSYGLIALLVLSVFPSVIPTSLGNEWGYYTQIFENDGMHYTFGCALFLYAVVLVINFLPESYQGMRNSMATAQSRPQRWLVAFKSTTKLSIYLLLLIVPGYFILIF